MEGRTIAIIVIVVLIVIVIICLACQSSARNSVTSIFKSKEKEPKVDTPPKKVGKESKLSDKVPTPKNISVRQDGNRIMAAWDLVPDAEHYTVYYSENPFDGTETDKSFGPIKENMFEMGCIPKGKYYVKITASKPVKSSSIGFSKMTESEPTPAREIVVDMCDKVEAPQNVTAERDGEIVKITWDVVPQADAYEIAVEEFDNDELHPHTTIMVDDPLSVLHYLDLPRGKNYVITIASDAKHCPGAAYSEATVI